MKKKTDIKLINSMQYFTPGSPEAQILETPTCGSSMYHTSSPQPVIPDYSHALNVTITLQSLKRDYSDLHAPSTIN